MKPYYEHAGITIYQADCRDVLPDLQPVDLVLTDPPYGMLKAEWDHLIPHSQWLPLARRLGPVLLFSGVRGLFDYPRPDWTLSWVRVASVQRNGTFGGFNNWEPILFYGNCRILNDTYSVQNLPDGDTGIHPTPKPLRLFRMILARFDAKTVLDPFMGSGTTLLAAKQLGHRAIGVELEERYCEIAAKRLEQEVFQFSPTAPIPEPLAFDWQEHDGLRRKHEDELMEEALDAH